MLGSLNPNSFASSVPLPSNGHGFINPEVIVETFGLQSGMKVADFGSGSGHFTLLMARKVGPSGVVTALDVLDNTLEVIRSKAATSGLTNLQTVRADLEVYGSSGLPDSSQNLVLAANILFQSNQKTEILKEAQRILEPGGELVIIEWKKDAGGLGPPMENRLNSGDVKADAQSLGFSFVREINAGVFHFGLIFRK